MTDSDTQEADSASSPPGAPLISCSVQLLVEGKDDMHLMRELIKARSLRRIQVPPYNGVDKLRRFLAGLVATPGFETVTSLGVLRDADEGCWRRLPERPGCPEGERHRAASEAGFT